MTVLAKTAVLAAIAAPLLMTNPAMASGCGPGDHGYCYDDPAPLSLEQVLVREAQRGLRSLDHYLEDRYRSGPRYRVQRRNKRR